MTPESKLRAKFGLGIGLAFFCHCTARLVALISGGQPDSVTRPMSMLLYMYEIVGDRKRVAHCLSI